MPGPPATSRQRAGSTPGSPHSASSWPSASWSWSAGRSRATSARDPRAPQHALSPSPGTSSLGACRFGAPWSHGTPGRETRPRNSDETRADGPSAGGGASWAPAHFHQVRPRREREPIMATTKTRASTGAKVRKRETSQHGNRGAFGTVTRGETEVAVPPAGTDSGPQLGEDVEIAPSARIDESASLGDEAAIGADVTIGPDVTLGEGVVVGDGSVIGDGARIEDGARLVEAVTVGDGVTVSDDSTIQARAILGDGAILGEEVFVSTESRIGRDVQIEADTRIGAQVAVDEGATVGEASEIEDRAKVRHSVRVGEQATIGKSAEL